MATNPFEQPLPSEQATQTATAGNPFDQPLASEAQPVLPSQPGFLQRAYETSPLPGVISAAKGAISDFVNAPVAGESNFHAMIDSLRQGDWHNAAAHAGQLLVGSDNPFKDAAASTIAQITKDAHTSGREAAMQLPGAQAAKNYVADVKAGNTTGAIGDVVGGVTSVAPLLMGDEASATKASDATSAVKNAVTDTASKAKTLVSEDAAAQSTQPAAQNAIRESTADVNKNLRVTEGVAPEASASIRDSVQDVADAVKARSKAAFQSLDEASGGRWQRFDDQLANLRDKMAETSGIDDEAYSKFEQRAQDIEAAQNDLINSLVKDGKIDPDMAENAKADYKQASALSDLSQQIRNATKGRVGFDAEQVNVSSLRDRINKMYDSGRLQDALGEDGANRFMQQISEANRVGKQAISRAKLAKSILKYAGVAAGAGALGHLAIGLAGSH